MIRFFLHALLFIMLAPTITSGQKRIVLIGSSTTAGGGASADAFKWAAKLQAVYRKNTDDGKDTSVERGLAMSGFVTYNAMPSDFVLPANRTGSPIDINRNVTKALSLFPDIIIVSLPSNDVNLNPDYSTNETMNNFRIMYKKITSAGVRCFITTSQPRNDVDLTKRQMLRDLKDSILNVFKGDALDFYSDLVTSDGLFNLKPELSADAIHPNDAGHELLFQRIMQKNIFIDPSNAPLPLSLKDFSIKTQQKSIQLNWKTEREENSPVFNLERSADGIVFKLLYKCNGKGTSALLNSYIWEDLDPLPGNNYYRLKIVDDSKAYYSKIINTSYNLSLKLIKKLYITPDELSIDIVSSNEEMATINLINIDGKRIKSYSIHLNANTTKFTSPVGALLTGCYFINIFTSSGKNEIIQFIKPAYH